MNIEKRYGTTNTTEEKNRKLEFISVHYSAGHNSEKGEAYNLVAWFNDPTAGGSADYVVDDELTVQYNGDIENRYCHAVGGDHYGNKGGRLYGTATNKNCISVEICSTNSTGEITYPNDPHYSFTDSAINRAVELVKYLMQKYKIDSNHVIRHYDVNGKPCPGIIGWNAESGDESKWFNFKARLGDLRRGTQASEINALATEQEKALKILDVVHEIAVKHNMLSSVAAAQTILESGYCGSDLALNANNVCGLKCALSGNTWANSTWDGRSKYIKVTVEHDALGNPHNETAEFRSYVCIEDSIEDRCQYLLGAMNGNVLRYAGIQSCINYKEQINLIKNGGYATDVNYVSKIINIIERFGLDKYDGERKHEEPTKTTEYYVQAGYFSVKANAQKLADKLKASGFDAIVKETNGRY